MEALITRAKLQVGETILIHGGAGDVGSIAIQLAVAVGARVFVRARSRDQKFLRYLGANAIIDYETEDYTTQIAQLTDRGPVSKCVAGTRWRRWLSIPLQLNLCVDNLLAATSGACAATSRTRTGSLRLLRRLESGPGRSEGVLA